jgi:hypothetical protein
MAGTCRHLTAQAAALTGPQIKATQAKVNFAESQSKAEDLVLRLQEVQLELDMLRNQV